MVRIEDKDALKMLEFRAAIISENLQRLRRITGLNKEEVAYLSNISISTMIYAERGLSREGSVYAPDILTLEKLAKTYGVGLSDILFKKNG